MASVALRLTQLHKPSLLQENGGCVNLSDSSCRPWTNSFLQRNNLVKRKATKAAKMVQENFEEIKTNFLSEITEAVREHKIPDHLIINMDETGLRIVPVDK